MQHPIKVIIADDYEIFRNGFKLLFKKQEELKIVAEASNGQELLDLVALHKPHLVITDIKMPVMDGIEACKELQKNYPEIGVIALTMFDEEDTTVQMLEAGARGYLLKNTTKEELLRCCKVVYQGSEYFCDATSLKLSKLIAANAYLFVKEEEKPQFTHRELEIIDLMCKEYTSKEIASILHISTRTVENIRKRIQEKTGAKNAVGIVVYAIKNKLINLM